MTVAKRMYLLMFVVVLGISALVGTGLYQINRVFQIANYPNINSFPSVFLLDKALAEFEEVNSLVWQHMTNTDNAKMSEIEIKVASTHKDLTDSLKLYEDTLISDKQDSDLLKQDREALAKFDEMAGNVLTDSLANKKSEARDILLANIQTIRAVQTAINNHRLYNSEIASTGAKEAERIKSAATTTAFLIGLAALAVVLGWGFYIIRNLLRELGDEPTNLASLARSFAAGDLTANIKVPDTDKSSVAYSIRRLQKTLKGLIDSLQYVSDAHDKGDIDETLKAEYFEGVFREVAQGINSMVSGQDRKSVV